MYWKSNKRKNKAYITEVAKLLTCNILLFYTHHNFIESSKWHLLLLNCHWNLKIFSWYEGMWWCLYIITVAHPIPGPITMGATDDVMRLRLRGGIWQWLVVIYWNTSWRNGLFILITSPLMFCSFSFESNFWRRFINQYQAPGFKT